MNFERNPAFDKLLVKAKQNKNILKALDYQQLVLFINYLVALNKFLASKGEK